MVLCNIMMKKNYKITFLFPLSSSSHTISPFLSPFLWSSYGLKSKEESHPLGGRDSRLKHHT